MHSESKSMASMFTFLSTNSQVKTHALIMHDTGDAAMDRDGISVFSSAYVALDTLRFAYDLFRPPSFQTFF